MPLGIERINSRRKQPNDRITFIKPLKGPDEAFAQDFLERIAAICNPIMKEHHLSIMSLEEYEPNLEFVGRNFNAGEVIQLVLKAPYTGHWLPFRYVQMVMMHELAHCNQMNHSGVFWKVRNTYAGELKTLWSKGYTGEGMWSRGITLYSGQYETDSLGAADVLPEHLCGGTYRSSRKRKRKVKEKLTYKEREARRIEKKFGTNGVALGADEDTKVKLEKGKKTAAKPRVAGSARGRELRAAAALARFEVKKEEPTIKNEEETESETESGGDGDANADEAIDINGKKILDQNGRGMVRVCEDEDKDDADARNEMSELRSLDFIKAEPTPSSTSILTSIPTQDGPPPSKVPARTMGPPNEQEKIKVKDQARAPGCQGLQMTSASNHSQACCLVCSMENVPAAPTCVVCANVLDPERVPGVWHCQSDTCKGGLYVNAGDCGVCGVCGARKCSNGI
jgi:DNA-dependent metalloprotease WSS1